MAVMVSIARQGKSDLSRLDGAVTKHVVHSLRLRMKKLQALLPLLSPGISAAANSRLHDQIQGIKQSLSPHRDKAAMEKLMCSLQRNLPGHPKLIASEGSNPFLSQSQLDQLRKRISALISGLQRITPAGPTDKQIKAAHLATETQVRKHYRRCRRNSSNKRMHRWRT